MINEIIVFIKKIQFLLTRNEKKKVIYLSFFIVILAIVETAGVASIAPFIAVVTNPDIITDNTYLLSLYHMLNMSSSYDFIFVVGIVVLLVLFLGNIFSALVKWQTLRFIAYRAQSLSERLLNKYINNDYEYFLTRNSSELANIILQEVTRVTTGIMLPLIQLFSKIIVAVFIVLLMIWVKPLVAVLSLIILGGAYSFVYFLVRLKLNKIAVDVSLKRKYRFKIISEAFSGIKDIKIFGKESAILDEYHQTAKIISNHESIGQTIVALPRYALETVVFSGLIIMVLILIRDGSNISEILPLITFYAFASYKLMPAIQEIYTGVTTIKYNSGALDELSMDLGYAENKSAASLELVANGKDSINQETIDFVKKIELQSIAFSYAGSSGEFIEDLTLTIDSNTTIGFAGETGSGKSTLIDLISGLLFPTRGTIKIDGVDLTSNNIHDWQKNIGYVSQSVYLMDASIAQNIAFEITESDINFETVRKVSKLANISNFIENELPDRYETIVGDRGVRLSGGQRQRIAIARALYHDPKVLILDEATSALDTLTESEVMQAINSVRNTKTVIIIAHRLSTLKQCDQIYILHKGKVVSKGTFSELTSTSETFQRLSGNKVH